MVSIALGNESKLFTMLDNLVGLSSTYLAVILMDVCPIKELAALISAPSSINLVAKLLLPECEEHPCRQHFL